MPDRFGDIGTQQSGAFKFIYKLCSSAARHVATDNIRRDFVVRT